MAQVRFIDAEGAEHRVTAEAGESLMHLGLRASIPGADGECGGEMSCATCHVYIGGEWAAKLRPRSQDEADLLEMDDRFSDESRLGCQVKVSDALDGLIARLPGQ